MTYYLDTSVIVPLFVRDPFVDSVRKFIAGNPPNLVISNIVSAEFSSVVAVRVRTGDLTRPEAFAAFANFDFWMKQKASFIEAHPADIETAIRNLRGLTMALRAPDAIHLAVTQRLGGQIVTFDRQMAAAARKLGIPVARV